MGPTRKEKKDYAIFIAIVALVVAGISLVVDWNQSMFFQSSNSPPDIVACLRSFSYEKGPEYDLGRSNVPVGDISFDLVNRGNTQATVHRVDVFPYGKRADGENAAMWLTLEVQETVPGNGIVTVEEFSFEDQRVYENRWVEELENVQIMVFWPNGNGPQLTCKLDKVTVKEGDWFCGYSRLGGYTVENACR